MDIPIEIVKQTNDGNLEKAKEFVTLIIGNIEPKIINGHKHTGFSLKQDLENWQQIMGEKKIEANSLLPIISDETGLELVFIRACNIYETELQSCIESNPTDDQLLNEHIAAEEHCWKYFTTEVNYHVCHENVNKAIDSLRERISKFYEICRNKNLQRIDNELKRTRIPGIARSVGNIKKSKQKSKNIVLLAIPCPGSYNGSCDPKEQFWLCEKCEDVLEYGFDGYFYCCCGKADAYSYQFKCNLKDHSINFLQFTETQLKFLLSNKEVNILILGETGVGMSTWINGFVNYLTYSSLAEAKEYPLLSLIASSYTITDDDYKRRVITCGEDVNEVFTTGESATQEPKAYVFPYENKLIRLIDTPGIGDTRGIDHDKNNFDAILRYLSNLDKFHVICILLKPNNTRLGVMFRFCIKELLTHLHRDASRNIVFCFTNARSTFYRPGDAMPALESLLNENKEVEIKPSKDTIYCMDNESFRFLCALHHGIEFDEEDYNNYAKSWDKSVIETKRLLNYICGLNPHSVMNTMSLNDTRKIIVRLSKPIADITQNILTNIRVVEDKKIEILKNKHTLRQGIELQIRNMEQYVNELNDEKNTIMKISAKFGGFLKANSIVPYNDALGEYLDVLIRLEKDKVGTGGDRKTLDSMEQMKLSYSEEVRIFDQLMTTGELGEQLSPIGIIELVNKLYALKHKGKELKQIMQVMTASKQQNHKFQETNYIVKNKEKSTNFFPKNMNNISNCQKFTKY